MGNHTTAIKTGIAAVVVAAVVAGAVLYPWTGQESAPAWTKPAPNPPAKQDHPQGGSVVIAVATPPELSDTGEGGDALRALVLPHLFLATADGKWQASLVEPGTDGAALDGLTAWFNIRPDAKWSNGTAITVDDLRRTKDDRFVESVDDPDSNGRITVHLKHKLPGWRQLWPSISPPSADIYGGPYRVKSLTSGLETVAVRSAGSNAFLDEVKLSYVPDSITQQQLLAAGELDVVAPIGDTVRQPHYERIDGVKVSTSSDGGAWTALKFNSVGSVDPNHAKVLSVFPRVAFTNSLLANEAHPLDGFVTNDTTWRDYGGAGGVNADGANVTLSAPSENPMTNLLTKSFQRAVKSAGGEAQIRSTDGAAVDRLVAAKTYDVAFIRKVSGPSFCWTCTFGDVDESLARQADAGDNNAALAVEKKARDEGSLMLLWREETVVAYRPAAVNGVVANGYAPSVASFADTWWRP